jgi:hypothetical protein
MDFQTYILSHFPLWLWGSLFVICICSVQLALNFVVDKIYPTEFLEKFNEITVNIFQVIGTIAAILYGLLVFLVLNNFQTVQADINLEATEAGNLFRNLVLVNAPEKMKPIQDNIFEYVQNDINNEFIIEAKGIVHGLDFQFKGWKILEKISRQILDSPEIKSELKSAIIDNINNLHKARRERINDETLALPKNVWSITIWSILIMLINVSLIGCQNKHYRKVYSVIFASALGLIMVLIFEIDRPFNGDIAVSDIYYKDLLVNMNHRLNQN